MGRHHFLPSRNAPDQSYHQGYAQRRLHRLPRDRAAEFQSVSRRHLGKALPSLAEEGTDSPHGQAQSHTGGFTMTLPTLDQQIAAVQREIVLRERVYPKWIETGRLTKQKADHEVACMKCVL